MRRKQPPSTTSSWPRCSRYRQTLLLVISLSRLRRAVLRADFAAGRGRMVIRLHHAGGGSSEPAVRGIHQHARRHRDQFPDPSDGALQRGAAPGSAVPEALELAVVNTGAGVVASAFIMALAFLMPMFTDFKGIAELGLISAAGLFMCMISAMLVFPAMVVLRDRSAGKRPSGQDVAGAGDVRRWRSFRASGLDYRSYRRPRPHGALLPSRRDCSIRTFSSCRRATRGGPLRKCAAERLRPLVVVRGLAAQTHKNRRPQSRRLPQAAGSLRRRDHRHLYSRRSGRRSARSCEHRAAKSRRFAIRPPARPGTADAMLRELERLHARLRRSRHSIPSGGAAKTRGLVASASAAARQPGGLRRL